MTSSLSDASDPSGSHPFEAPSAHESDPGFETADSSFGDDDEAPAFGAAIDEVPSDAEERPKRKTRARRTTKKATTKKAVTKKARTTKARKVAVAEEPEVEAAADAEATVAEEAPKASRSKRSRTTRSSTSRRTKGSKAKPVTEDGDIEGRSPESQEDLAPEPIPVEELRGLEDEMLELQAEEAPPARKKRSRRGRGRSRRAAEEEPAEESEAAEAPDAPDRDAPDRDADPEPEQNADREDAVSDEASEEEPRRKRRRGTRGGRRRKRSRAKSEGDDELRDDAPRAEVDEGAATLGIDAIPGEEDELDDEAADAGPGRGAGHKAVVGSKHRRGRGRRKRVVGDEEDGPKRKVSSRHKRVEDEPEAGRKKKRRGRRSKPEREREDEEESTVKEPVRDQMILVNAHDPDETRVVCVENERIVDLQMTVDHHKSFVNDIYRGRVVNLETNIGAAFVDFGQGKNGFLHLSDVMDFYGEDDFSLDRLLEARTNEEEWENRGSAAGDADANADSDPEEGDDEEDEEEEGGKRSKRGRGRSKSSKTASKKKVAKQRSKPRRGNSRRAIGDLLSKGQLVVCQITKDAIGDKGPTLTTFISIPGRYLVLMPSLQRTGVSRKIEDEKERRRLKRILTGLETPENMGVIVRTAGIGKTKADIKRDLDYLLAVWKQFSKSLVLGRAPAPLYQESDVAIRTMRDMFSSRTKAVIVDDEEVYEKMREFTTKLMPEHLERIELHTDDKPLFHHYGIEPDFEKIFSRRVELPAGGSIVIDQTEALVAIDVNSGRTRDEGAGFEDIALKTNLEAVTEIARQIKLRDMGGILVLDFIDMMRASSRRKVENAFRDCLANDRARNKVGRISQFGLLELTRQRLGPGLSKLLYEPCSTCRGSGRRRTAQSRAQALLRRLGSALTQKGFTKIEILAHPDTIDWLKTQDGAELKELETRSKRELIFKAVENQVEDSIFHYLRADGREVRPGGRRKR